MFPLWRVLSPLLKIQGGLCMTRKSSEQKINQILALSKTEVCAEAASRGLVLGVYVDKNNQFDAGEFTPSGKRYDTQKTAGRLFEVLKMSGPIPDVGEARLLFAVETERIPYYSVVAVVGLGHDCLGYNSYEVLDERKEAIRRSVAAACKALLDLETDKIDVENCGHAESAAEGAVLGVFKYQELKDKKHRQYIPGLDLYTFQDEVCDWEGWRLGMQKATAQNLCRELQEAPANHLTPNAFAEKVIQVLCRSGVNVEVKVEGWAESQKMNGFLGVARASCEAPLFLELTYYGGAKNDRPIILIGQGITYDCGGLTLKKKRELKIMRGNMTGAAVVVATMKAIASLRLPINIRGLIPLCENVMGCNAFKPGDTFECQNGSSILAKNTDHDEVLILGDALLYAQNFCPRFIVDIGTISGGLRQTFDESATAVFTNSEVLWQQIKSASIHTGDRVWRMPVWDYYSRSVTESDIDSDIQVYGHSHSANPCQAAAVLREFVPCGQWMHLDCANVMYTWGDDFEYLSKGMAGRPTRTMIEFIAQSLCKEQQPKIPAQ